jgi:protein O-mannosyl-transferase
MLEVKPWPMSFYYGYKEVNSHTMKEPDVIFSILFFLLLIGLALMSVKKNQALSFSLFFMILSILPYLCVVSVIPGMIADRYSFQSSFGFSILLAMGFGYFHDLPEASVLLKYISTSRLKQITKYTFVFVVSCYTSISIVRNGQWKDSVTLMRHDIQVVPQSIQAHNLLAHHLIERSFEITDAAEQRQMREESLLHFKRSVELYPTFFNTNFDLARNFALLNQADSAIFWFKKSINIDTTFMEAYLSVGELYFQTNQYENAIPYFESVSRNQPNRYAAYDRLGLIYMRQYKYDKAMAIYTDAIKNVPEVAGSYLNIGIIYSNTHKIDSARFWFQKALQVSPGNKDAEQLLQGLGKISR